MEASQEAQQTARPGWYEFNGGMRYYDGGWTEHFAYVQPRTEISYLGIWAAVVVGMVVGWFIIWAAAQAAPDTFYWPVKFVVKTLPTFGQ
jgi:hypothetical protein